MSKLQNPSLETATERPWPADKVERWPVAKLNPSARNARTHPEAQIAQIAASIVEWGWTTPALVDEQGSLIAGHGRVLAARQLGLAEIPVMIAKGWTDAQKRAYALRRQQASFAGRLERSPVAHRTNRSPRDGWSISRRWGFRLMRQQRSSLTAPRD